MYTLRLFKEVSAVDRTQVFLGDVYTVIEATKKDAEIGVKLRVHGGSDFEPEDGIAVYYDDHAFIILPTGGTFETLNKPK
jgi:hypothetical protein